MTTANVGAVKAEIAHDGSPTGKVGSVKAEVAHGGSPTGKVGGVKSEVAHGGSPVGRIAAVKVEIAYSIRPFVPAWPAAEMPIASGGGIGAGPIAATVFYAPYPVQGSLTAAGGCTVAFGGIGATQNQATLDTRAFSNFNAVSLIPSVFNMQGAGVMLVSAVRTGSTFEIAGVGTLSGVAVAAGPMTYSINAGGTASFIAPARASLVVSGEAVSRFYGLAATPARLAVNAISNVGFSGVGAGVGALSAAGLSTASFTGKALANGYWRSDAYATVAFTQSRALGAKLVSQGQANAFFANGSIRPTTLNIAGASSVAFGGNALTYTFGLNGSNTTVFYGLGSAISALTAAGASSAAFFTSNQFTMRGLSSVVFASDLTWLANFSSTGLATANFNSQGALTTAFQMAGASSFTAVPAVSFQMVGGSVVAFRGTQPAAGTLNAAGGAAVVMVPAALVKAVATAMGASTAAFSGAEGVQATGAAAGSAAVAFVGAGLAGAVTHFDGATQAGFQGRGLGIGVLRGNGLASMRMAAQVGAAGALQANGATSAAFAGIAEIGGALTAGGAAAVAWTSNLEAQSVLTASGGVGVQFRGTGVVYSQFYSVGKGTFTAIFGETISAAMSSVGAADVRFGSSAIKRSVMTAVGYSVVIGYSHESMVLNPGKVEVTWKVPDTEAIWSEAANTVVAIEQQASVGGSVTRQADMTVKWEL